MTVNIIQTLKEMMDNKDIFIWRYMDIHRLISLLKDKLVLPNANLMRDPFEGTLTDLTLKNDLPRKQITLLGELNESLRQVDINKHEQLRQKIDLLEEKSIIDNKNDKKVNFLSCWHMNNNESMLLWQNYAMIGGIAIKVNLSEFLNYYKANNPQPSFAFIAANVNYIDYSKEEIENWRLTKFFHKRIEYKHEEEFRLIVAVPEYLRILNSDPNAELPKTIELPFNFDLLVKKIIVSPLVQNWNYENIKTLVSKFEKNVPVKKSSLSQTPFY